MGVCMCVWCMCVVRVTLPHGTGHSANRYCLLQGDEDEEVLYEDFDDAATMRELEALS